MGDFKTRLVERQKSEILGLRQQLEQANKQIAKLKGEVVDVDSVDYTVDTEAESRANAIFAALVNTGEADIKRELLVMYEKGRTDARGMKLSAQALEWQKCQTELWKHRFEVAQDELTERRTKQIEVLQLEFRNHTGWRWLKSAIACLFAGHSYPPTTSGWVNYGSQPGDRCFRCGRFR